MSSPSNAPVPTIVFIGCYDFGPSLEAIEAAIRLGLNTVLFISSEKQLEHMNQHCEVHVIPVSDISNLQALRGRLRGLQEHGFEILGICSFIDPFVLIASVFSREFCPRAEGETLSPDTVMNMHNKILTRECLRNTPFNPYFDVFDGNEPLHKFIERNEPHLPLVMKAPVSTGSRDVLFVETVEQFAALLSRFKTKHRTQPVLVEKYIDGPQYLVEVVVSNEKIHIVAVIEQEITKQRRFIVTGYSLLAENPLFFYIELAAVVRTIVQTMGMKHGTCHLEFRRANHEWKLIEINPRIAGGAMNQMIQHAFGINLVEEEIKLFLGRKIDLQKKQRNYVYTQYITVPISGVLQKISGVKQASQYKGVKEVYIKPQPGDVLKPPYSMGHRYAYVLASSESKEEARNIAKKAAACIEFHLSTVEQAESETRTSEPRKTERKKRKRIQKDKKAGTSNKAGVTEKRRKKRKQERRREGKDDDVIRNASPSRRPEDGL